MRTASASCAGVMLSRSTASIGSVERFAKLIERIDLDFDLHHVADARATRPPRPREPSRRARDDCL